MPSRRSRFLAPPLLALAASAGVALGRDPGPATLLMQELPEPGRQEAPGRPVTVVLDAESRLYFRSDIRGEGDADVLVSHTGAGVTVIGRASEDLRVTFNIGGQFDDYDWSNAESVLPGGSEAFEDLWGARILLAGRQRIRGPWNVVLGGLARAQGEGEADFGDSLTGGGFLAAGYDLGPASWIDFGVGVFSRLEDDPLVIPYVSFRVPIDEEKNIRLEGDGLSVAVVASISPVLDVSLRGGVEFRDFRLDDSRPAWRDGIVRDFRVPVGIELAWKPAAGLTLALEGGVAVYQEYEFFDDDGDDLGDVETDPAPFIGLRIEYRF
jgi:hypothetical protein